jgi:rubrerythrin
MTDYTKLVAALRCGEYKPECGASDCPYWSGLGCMDGQLMTDAADAIEALQKAKAIANRKLDSALKRMPKRGEWKPFDLTYGRSIYSCSVCEQATEVPMCMEKPMYAYCPNCGAKMEVQE